MKSNGQLDLKSKTPSGVDKVSRYKWTIRNKQGEFHWIKKEDLHVDHSYQRNKINTRRVDEISKSWDHVSCGVVIVCLRDDNEWWVIDGQHRKLAADKRSDITHLPCMVFELDTIKDEALAFLGINTGKVGVPSHDRFKAMCVAGDENALGLVRTLASTGHKYGPTSSVKTVACVICLLNFYKEDPDKFKRVWPLIADMHTASPVSDSVVKGVWCADKWLEKDNRKLSESPYREKLISLSGQAASAIIRQESVLIGHSNRRVCGAAIAKWLNRQRLPSGHKINFQ